MAKKATNASENEPRRFEFRDGKSEKFWEIQLNDLSHTVTYGRFGTAGQSKTKEFADAAKTKASYDKLIKQKTSKGYKEIIAAPTMSAEDKAARKAKEKAMAPFIKTILEDPARIDGYAVYADWLVERGDPQGEFAQIQIELEDENCKAAQRKKLQKQEKALLVKHQREWLGELAPYLIDQKDYENSWRGTTCYTFQFARGLLDSITTAEFHPDFGTVLKKSIECRTLRHLAIDNTSWDHEDGVNSLVGARFDNLVSFRLGEENESNCHSDGESVHELVKKMPRIQRLHFEARSVDTESIFKMKMPHLTSLNVHHIHKYPVELLAKNKSLGNLETMRFHPHAMEYDDDQTAYLDLKDMQAICKSKNLGSLKHIQFRLSDMGNPGAELIINSGLIDRLEVLDLKHGCITDEGAELFANCEAAKSLQMLNLDGNGLTKKGIDLLKKARIKHTAKAQHSAAALNEEREYLWYGDIE